MDDWVVTSVASPELLPNVGEPQWAIVLSFIARLVEALAWPGLLAVLVVIFYKHIIRVLQNLKSFKWGDAEATFGTELQEAREKAKGIEPVEQQIAAANEPRFKQLVEMAATSPTGAIIEAWKNVMDSIISLIQRSMIAPSTSTTTNAVSLINLLKKYSLLPPQEMAVLQDLRVLRNKAAHSNDGDISVDQARQYVMLADKLTDVMDAIAVNGTPDDGNQGGI